MIYKMQLVKTIYLQVVIIFHISVFIILKNLFYGIISPAQSD